MSIAKLVTILRADWRRTERHRERLLIALTEASKHLDYCGYGDAWERECAQHDRLEGRIKAALANKPLPPRPASMADAKKSKDQLKKRTKRARKGKHE